MRVALQKLDRDERFGGIDRQLQKKKKDNGSEGEIFLLRKRFISLIRRNQQLPEPLFRAFRFFLPCRMQRELFPSFDPATLTLLLSEQRNFHSISFEIFFPFILLTFLFSMFESNSHYA